MAGLSDAQIAQLAYQVGFRGDALVKMVGIAKRESGNNPSAKNPNTSDTGLWQVNAANDKFLISQGIIHQHSDLLDPVTNARAAWALSKQGTNFSPWNGSSKGWSATGNPTYGVNLGAAQTAVNAAASQGLLGQDYGAAAATPATPSPQQGGSTMIAQEERESFDKYLKGLPADQQKKIVEDLKTPRDLPGVAAYMSQASPEVNRYIKFLSTLDAGNQYSEKSLLAAPDPQGSTEMTNLLSTLGVSYPNAPNPTPALLAFLNGLGLNLQTASDVKQRALERIGASTSDAMADIDRTAGKARENVTSDLVRRGVLQSGEANTRYARQDENVASQRSDVQRTGTQATEQVEDTYTQARSLARQQALDRILGAEQDQASARATSAAQVDATRAAQQASDDAWSKQQAAQDAALKQQEDALRQYGAQGAAV